MLSVTKLTVSGGNVMQLNTYRFIWVVTLNGMFQQDVPFECYEVGGKKYEVRRALFSNIRQAV